MNTVGRLSEDHARDAVSLSPYGPWLPHGPGGGAELEVHDRDGPRLRVLDRRYRYGIELWLYTRMRPRSP